MKPHSRQLIEILKGVGWEQKPILLGAEVGCWRGENSKELLQAFPHLILHMVDRFKVLTKEEAKSSRRLGKFTQRDFDDARTHAYKITDFAKSRRSICVMTSEDAAGVVGNEELDFVFIDAAHDYENVRNDIRLWTPKVRPGGIIAGHDYNGTGDKKGRFGVKRAVDEFFGEDNINDCGRPSLVWWLVKK